MEDGSERTGERKEMGLTIRMNEEAITSRL